MSSQQQALIVDTIVAMRKAMKRKAYESDSDSDVETNTNRGHKLQKRSRFVRRGYLPSSLAPGVFREVTDHAGFQRAIINRNPPLIDDEGYDVDSDDSEERVQTSVAAAADENPYSSVHLEHILAPLTSVTELPTHPTLSRPFVSKALTKLVVQGRDLMHRENAALWKVRPLLTRLQGDHTWVPCGLMTEPGDGELFSDDYLSRSRHAWSEATPTINGASGKASASGDGPSSQADSRDASRGSGSSHNDTNDEGSSRSTAPDGTDKLEASGSARRETLGQSDNSSRRDVLPGLHPTSVAAEWAAEWDAAVAARINGHPRKDQTTREEDTGKDGRNPDGSAADVEMTQAPEAEGEAGLAGPGTAGGASRGGSRAASGSPETANDLFIHPIFRPPRAALPDRDQGLPEQEGEDIRRLLQLYVQKQEEVCRGTTRLYMDLLRADRYRQTVLKWAKAEAHCGERRDMSDGEDWYDKEEWGLTEDLKKGQDEEEEDTTVQTQKKTRSRK